jgi:hypothetical protein
MIVRANVKKQKHESIIFMHLYKKYKNNKYEKNYI